MDKKCGFCGEKANVSGLCDDCHDCIRHLEEIINVNPREAIKYLEVKLAYAKKIRANRYMSKEV